MHLGRWICGCMAAIAALSARAEPLSLVRPSPLPVVVAPTASTVERFAADELVRYLSEITGAAFSVQSTATAPDSALLVGRAWAGLAVGDVSVAALGEEGFVVQRTGRRVCLVGGGDRGTLYAAYALLEQLGCRWFAPNFAFYGVARGERVPRLPDPSVGELGLRERPSFTRRELYIEEGETHTPENLRQLVDWMAKARLNTLTCPIDYQARGKTKWDNWRAELIPELRKRGILVAVGGHGYQVFLPPARYFTSHPEWFGVIGGRRSDDPHVAFSTANSEAVATYVANVRTYLREHPEIDIFDCRPPDAVKWSEAPEDVALGSPTDRQLRLINRLAADLAGEFPRLQIRLEAYEPGIEPPQSAKPASDRIQVEFCPIDRSFVAPLFDLKVAKNAAYARQIERWLDVVPASRVSVCTYLTKYQWRTLPIVIPHLIARDVKKWAELGLAGAGSYSEPGGWAALELDHYFLAHFLWSAADDPEAVLQDYAESRYAPAAKPVRAYLHLLEEIVPRAVGIPGTVLDRTKQRNYIARFRAAKALLAEARQAAAGDPATLAAIAKLEGSWRYAANEMALRAEFMDAARGWKRDQLTRVAQLLAERERIIAENRTAGLMVVDARTR